LVGLRLSLCPGLLLGLACALGVLTLSLLLPLLVLDLLQLLPVHPLLAPLEVLLVVLAVRTLDEAQRHALA
jgi:hypothetical protein